MAMSLFGSSMLKKLRHLHATPASNECFHFFNWPHAVLSSSPVPTPVTKKVIEFISLLHKPNGFNDSDAWLKTLDVNIWDMKNNYSNQRHYRHYGFLYLQCSSGIWQHGPSGEGLIAL